MSRINIVIGFWKWCRENNLAPTNKRYIAFKAGIEFVNGKDLK